MDLKKEAARSAVTFIKDNTIVGLGGGSTIQHMVHFLAPSLTDGLNIQIITSSFTTRQLLLQKNCVVHPMQNFSAVDIYFDGCDQLDKNLNALKCGGGIHTSEKILASMAKEFILAGDETKYADELQTKFPLVIEVLPQAFNYAIACLRNLYAGTKVITRMSDKNDGPVITANGNYLLDMWFNVWPNLKEINPAVKAIAGVVETSLFYKMAHKAILATPDKIKILEKTL